MLLKSGFSGLLTSNGIGTTEIAPPPQSGGGGTSQPPPPNHPQATSVIGGSVSTFKGGHQPQAPHSTNLSNGSPIMRGNHNHMNNNNNNETLQHSLGHLSEHPQQQQQHLQQVTSSPLSSFKMNYFQKNGASSLFAIANRNGAGGATGGNGVPVDNNNSFNTSANPHEGPASMDYVDCGAATAGHLMNPEVGKLKPVPQQEMPFPVLSCSPQKGLSSQNGSGVPSQVGHHQQQSVSYLHTSNGLDIDHQQQPPPFMDSVRTEGGGVGMVAVKEDLPPSDCFSMTNHQRHDEIQLLNQIQDTLKEGWTVHLAENGRLYYCK